MKAYKIMLIIQVVLMYLAHTPFYIITIFANTSIDSSIGDSLFPGLLLTGIILSLLVLPLCLANLIVAIIGLIRGQNNPCKTTMVVKIALIPWFIYNFCLCVALTAGFLNPWLFLAAPILICLLMGITYLLMLSTSLFDISYTIHMLIRRKVKVGGVIITSLIFLIMFCFDVVGSIMLHIKMKSIQSE